MILHFGARRATRDVDALIVRGDLAEFRRAVKTVARRHDLPEDWLNDAAKGFADILPPDFESRLVPIGLELKHIRAYFLGLPDQTAMKIVALREQDLEDLEILMPQMSDSEKKTLIGIMKHVATFRPDWALRIRYFLQEKGWEIS